MSMINKAYMVNTSNDNKNPGSTDNFSILVKVSPDLNSNSTLETSYDRIIFDGVEVDLTYVEKKSIYYTLAVRFESQEEDKKKKALETILAHKEK